MTAPISNYRIPLVDPNATGPTWQEASRNFIWTARHAAGETPYDVALFLPEGVVRLPDRERMFHVIPTGRAHRIEHGFGFWRVCGSDALFIKSVYEDGVAYMMVISTSPSAYTSDILRWSCVQCGATIREIEVPTRRVHLRGLLERALNEVRSFNATDRACPSCATVQPLSYGFDPAADTEEERAARSAW